jgi:hypothetical protein
LLAFKVDNFPAHNVEFKRIEIFDSELGDRELVLSRILEQTISKMNLKYLCVPLESCFFIPAEVKVSFQVD